MALTPPVRLFAYIGMYEAYTDLHGAYTGTYAKVSEVARVRAYTGIPVYGACRGICEAYTGTYRYDVCCQCGDSLKTEVSGVMRIRVCMRRTCASYGHRWCVYVLIRNYTGHICGLYGHI